MKVYEYYIQQRNEEEFLLIQKMAQSIYKRYLDCHVIYLNNKEDRRKWLEIAFYASEEAYLEGVEKVNKHIEIQELFRRFESILDNKKEIKEENYIERLRL